MITPRIKTILQDVVPLTTLTVQGWVRSFRSNRFIALNDGSCMENLQCVIDFDSLSEELLKKITVGAALKITGMLQESEGKGQRVEVQVTEVEILGVSDPETYPIQPKKHSLEFLRQNA